MTFRPKYSIIWSGGETLKRIVLLPFILLLIVATVSLFACVDENPPTENPPTENPPVENSPTERQTLSISPDGFSIFFSDVPGKSIILADGREYRAGDLLPVFSELSDVLSLNFSECADSADIVFGSVGALSSRGIAGEFLNLSEHLDDMPSFKAFLDSNPLVRLAVSTDEYGAFYVIPYLADGGYDVSFFNTSLVRELLDGEGAFVSESDELIENAVYTPYMPTSGSISVGIMKDGELIEELTQEQIADLCRTPLEIISSAPSAAVDTLRGIYPEARIEENDGKIYIYMDEIDPAEINRTLVKSGFDVSELKRERVALEDFFIKRMG